MRTLLLASNGEESNLVISDEANPVAVAGVMGGKDSEVTENTREIVLEAAVFNPVRVRKGANKKTALPDGRPLGFFLFWGILP